MKFYNRQLGKIAPIYPAVTPNYAKLAVNNVIRQRNGLWPNCLVSRDFNYFDPNGSLFCYPNTLISAGVILGKNSTDKPKPMMTDLGRRNPGFTSVLLDSGGFSIIKRAMNFRGNPTRKAILEFCLHYGADGAMTLDIPPRLFNSQFSDFESCLNTTVENLQYIVDRCPEDLLPLFLNVLQGETPEQMDAWDTAISRFPIPNFAFAGTQYKKMTEFLRRLVVLLHSGRLEQTTWLHALGTEKLTLACAFTTVQECLSECLGRPVKVSFDSASAFNEVNERGKCFRAFSLTKRGFSLSTGFVPDAPRFVGSAEPFPFQGISAVSAELTLGDLCINSKPTKRSTWDELSYQILQNHNLDVIIGGIIAANSRYQLPTDEALKLCPAWLIRAREGIRRVLQSESPMDMIERYRADFDMLNEYIDPLTMDDFR